MGNFDQCTGIKVDLSNSAAQNMLYGQYCLAEINFMEEQEVQQIRNYTLDPYSMKFNPKRTAWDRIKYAGDPTKSRRDVIHWSLCIPASCSPASVEDALVQAMNWVNEVYGKSLNIKVRIPERMCITNRNDEFLNAYDITFSVFLTTLSFTVIAATAYDLNTMTDNEENAGTKTGMVKRIILCFSARKNFLNIFKVKASEDNHGLNCIHGLRFMSMLLIIMAHRALAIISGPLFNPEVVEQAYRQPEGSFLINGMIIVDTFFLFGGLLTTYFLLIELDKRKNLNFIKLFILRFVRLTPVYAVVVIFHATLFYKMGSGPLWDSKVGLERDRCINSWWTNLLYINNYVMNDKTCMPQSWYLSCDMQFFIPSLFIVHLIWKKPRIGLNLLGIATFLSLLIPFLIIFIEEKDAMLLPYIRNLKDIQSYENFISFYIKAHNRACPYLVGIITGFIFYKFRDSKFKFTKIQSHVGFTCCFILSVTTIISGNLFYYPGNQYNALESAFYGSFFRISWAASIGFGLFVFSKGDLGPLKRTVEWKAFIPLSRLTYCAYLVHTIIQLYHLGSLRKPEYISVRNVLWQTAGDIFVTFLASLLLCLSIEAPTRAIEKVLFRRS
ncbi:nose resistant to fluoxetine protein 6-like [Ischnura elegans]|uniref:nose resistant to fluoxetine protein 6-like n=1 Tax=Ischnura elegans TaxID=197161 RepID=UPI001ED8AEC5|nr:nose resistant to fluoxetine protein 6-like [Ischnura elegans]